MIWPKTNRSFLEKNNGTVAGLEAATVFFGVKILSPSFNSVMISTNKFSLNYYLSTDALRKFERPLRYMDLLVNTCLIYKTTLLLSTTLIAIKTSLLYTVINSLLLRSASLPTTILWPLVASIRTYAYGTCNSVTLSKHFLRIKPQSRQSNLSRTLIIFGVEAGMVCLKCGTWTLMN